MIATYRDQHCPEGIKDLSSHKSPTARDWRMVLIPAPYSPDLNLIEIVFSKLNALIRKAAARTYDDLWQAVGRVRDLFSEEECYSYFGVTGYKAN